jgi:hypothetical protein
LLVPKFDSLIKHSNFKIAMLLDLE